MKCIIGLLMAVSLPLVTAPVWAELSSNQLNFIEKVANTFDRNPRMSKDFGEYIRKFKTYTCTATPVKRFDESFTELFFGTTNFYREAMSMTCPTTIKILLWRSDTNTASYYVHDREFSRYALNIGDHCNSTDGCNPTQINGISFSGDVISHYQLSGSNVDADYKTWVRFNDRNYEDMKSREAFMQRAQERDACKRDAWSRGGISGGLGYGC